MRACVRVQVCVYACVRETHRPDDECRAPIFERLKLGDLRRFIFGLRPVPLLQTSECLGGAYTLPGKPTPINSVTNADEKARLHAI
jgi:hypothetical protein